MKVYHEEKILSKSEKLDAMKRFPNFVDVTDPKGDLDISKFLKAHKRMFVGDKDAVVVSAPSEAFIIELDKSKLKVIEQIPTPYLNLVVKRPPRSAITNVYRKGKKRWPYTVLIIVAIRIVESNFCLQEHEMPTRLLIK